MSPSNPSTERKPSGFAPRAPRVLVIEDNRDLRELFASELELAGFIVSRATNGREGLDEVRPFNPDIIVLDLMLPGLSGFAVARVVRGLHENRNVAILAVSALTSEALRQEALASGCDAFLAKPVIAARVVESACSLLASRGFAIRSVG